MHFTVRSFFFRCWRSLLFSKRLVFFSLLPKSLVDYENRKESVRETEKSSNFFQRQRCGTAASQKCSDMQNSMTNIYCTYKEYRFFWIFFFLVFTFGRLLLIEREGGYIWGEGVSF